LQWRYGSTLDFSKEALSAAEKGFRKLSNALSVLKKLDFQPLGAEDHEKRNEIEKLVNACYVNMSDDFNTAKTLAVLFEMTTWINNWKAGQDTAISIETFKRFKQTYISMMEDVLGLREEEEHNQEMIDGVIKVLIELRKKARTDKNYALSDKIRDDLKALGVQLMDGKGGEMTYSFE
jgi:cysteinyl-tRNA synthetase